MTRSRLARLFAMFAAAFVIASSAAVVTAGPASAAVCGPGMFDGDGQCYYVPQGSYMPYSGYEYAFACPEGYSTASYGATSPSQCNVPSPAGSYGTEQLYDFFDPDFFIAVFELCAPGTYQPFTAQVSCYSAPPGTYIAVSGATSTSYAQYCPGGTFSTGGASSCTDASPGYRPNAFTGATGQVACSPGTTSPGGQPSCALAPPGYFAPYYAMSSPIACGAGSYSSYAGATSCVLADVDHYVPTDAATYQLPCPAGTSQPSTGSTSCIGVPTKQDQTITFAAPGDQIIGASITLDATATSGLTVAFSSLTPSVCSVTGSTVTAGSTGTCTIQADQDGNAAWNAAAPKEQTFEVNYGFVGFAQPVDGTGLNSAKAGRTVPLKWRVVDAYQNPITDLTAVTVKAVTLTCATGVTADAIEEYAAGTSGLQNLGDGYYQWNWQTPTSYAKSCKTVTVDLGDDATHTAAFTFTK